MHRIASTACALTLVGLLAGCSQDEAPAQARPEPVSTFTAGEVPVVVPGAPGEPDTVLEPGQTGSIANVDAYRDADVRFMTDMVAHHKQALQMAELAPDRAADDRVRRLAERIAAGQGPEISVMQGWLDERGLPAGDESGDHGAHQGMPGMATPERVTRLVAADGAGFDRLFLELMTAHHRGALVMADRATGAAHPVVAEQVADTVATQSVEIDRMQEVLAALPR